MKFGAFFTLFAVYTVEGFAKASLLSLAPMVNEPNDELSATTHNTAIKIVLGFFDKEDAQCAFVIGDNCSLMKLLQSYSRFF